jgi:hypothetical protein
MVKAQKLKYKGFLNGPYFLNVSKKGNGNIKKLRNIKLYPLRLTLNGSGTNLGQKGFLNGPYPLNVSKRAKHKRVWP